MLEKLLLFALVSSIGDLIAVDGHEKGIDTSNAVDKNEASSLNKIASHGSHEIRVEGPKPVHNFHHHDEKHHQGQNKTYHKRDFVEMNEFVFGQRALYREPCDYKLYVEKVRPIYDLVKASQADSNRTDTGFLWVEMQRKYVDDMKSNRSLRALTCHSNHMMQCSDDLDDKGQHFCECLVHPPNYLLLYEEETFECRVQDFHQYFDVFGVNCRSHSFCIQTEEKGKCICLPQKQYPQIKKGNCTGF